MESITKNSDLRSIINAWRRQGERIAFVPTMGNLHQGHLSLVEKARAGADRVVASIFVNPLQFGPSEDFASYPRTLEEDRLKLEEVDADLLYLPTDHEMYPHGTELVSRVEVTGISDELCGAFRPGFFSGVATVVAKLFNLVQPDVAIFGKKDYQQLIVIRRMVKDLDWPIEVLGGETVREADGLAMSSRNQYLSESQRALAPIIYQTLQSLGKQLCDGERDYASLEQGAIDAMTAVGLRVDYVNVRRTVDLTVPGSESESETGNQQLVALAAAWCGPARLIDNIEISIS